MYCQSCGAENQDGAKFCKQCGAVVEEAQGEASPTENVAASPSLLETPPPPPPPGMFAGQPAPQVAAGSSFDLRNLLFMSKVVEYISKGALFKRIVAIALYVLSVVLGLAALFVGGTFIVGAFDLGGAGGIISGLLSIPVVIVFTYMMVHTLLIRAKTVRGLSDGRYSVIPIVSVLSKLLGELSAVVWVYMGIQWAIAFWILPLGNRYYRGVGIQAIDLGAAGFVGGLLALAMSLAIAFFGLVLFYLLSEAIGVLADLATDVKKVADAQETAEA